MTPHQKQKLAIARLEAERFLGKVSSLEEQKESPSSLAGLKRSSLDLTKSLAAWRQSFRWDSK